MLTVLSLFDFTGNWSRPYRDAGYDVRQVDLRVEATEGSKMHLLPPSPDRAAKRSETPMGFARAFFEANP